MDLPYLLLNIHPLHPLHLLPLVQLPIIAQRRLLPPRLLLLADDRLARHAIEDVRPLRCETFQVGGDV